VNTAKPTEHYRHLAMTTNPSADPLTKVWSDFLAAWCRLRALSEEGGVIVTMDIKVKEVPKKKGKRRAK